MILDYCDVIPKVHTIPQFDMKSTTEWHGVKAIWYEGASYHGLKTKVFALVGYPEIKENEKVPAIVLVHGGGGHPYAEWIRRWNERGYAAIAIDTTGYFPKAEFQGVVGTEKAGDGDKFTRELYGELKEVGYTVGPDNGGMQDFYLPQEEQWMYHAVIDTILGHNILRNDSRIDSKKIGISGISWGGVVASIAIGYDSRYAFAIPIYGSGYLDYLPAPKLPRVFGKPEVKKYWNASDRFSDVSYPVYWMCFCEDTCFSFGANSMSYEATKKQGACLSIKRGMGHSHIEGWIQNEAYRFADKVLCGEKAFPFCVTEPKGFGEIKFTLEIPQDYDSISAEAFYITKPIEYGEKNQLLNVWESTELQICDGIVSGNVPNEACGYFVEFKGSVGVESYISTSAWVERFR